MTHRLIAAILGAILVGTAAAWLATSRLSTFLDSVSVLGR